MASQVESEAMQNLPDWQTMPRPMITSDMLSEFDGNHVTLMGSVKSVESELLIVDDGTNKNITCNVEFSDMLDGISISDYVEVQGEVKGVHLEAKIVTKVEGATYGLRHKPLTALKPYYNILYANKA